MLSKSTQLDLAKPTVVLNTCVCFSLRKASRAVTQFFDEILQTSGLLVTQFTVLAAIDLTGSATMTHLAQWLVMDRTTLTRNLKPLERQGLIKIEPGKDQRMRVVTLTAEGHAAIAKALPLWEQAQTSVVEGLGQEQWSALLEGLSDTVSWVRDT